MDRREDLRCSSAQLRSKMRGRTHLHVQYRGLQTVGAGRAARESMRALKRRPPCGALMIRYLLDTDVIPEVRKPKRHGGVLA